jgi:predicted phosphatase
MDPPWLRKTEAVLEDAKWNFEGLSIAVSVLSVFHVSHLLA